MEREREQLRVVRRAACLAVVLATVGTAGGLSAQDVEGAITELAEENGKLYAHPVVSGFGAGLNSGWFRGASPRRPFSFDFSILAAGAFAPEADETFTPDFTSATEFLRDVTGKTYTNPYGTETTPTAVGSGPGTEYQPQGEYRDDIIANESVTGVSVDDATLSFPQGLDIPAVPLLLLQGAAGLPLGTEVVVRFIPSVEVSEDVGSLQAFGVGALHSVSQWLPAPLPVDVAVGGGIQSFEVGDYLEADARQVSLVVSKNLAVLTLFAAGTLEESEVDISYTVSNPDGDPTLPPDGTELAVSDEGDNSSRLTVGFGLDLLVLKLNAEYSFAEYPVVAATLGLGI